MNWPCVVVHPDADTLAEAVAARLLLRILDAQSVRNPVHVGLTGGTIGIAALAAASASPLRAAVDWTGVHLWWGDERFWPAGHPDRNETQARAALLDRLADLPPANVHPIPGPGPYVVNPEQAAQAYARQLAAFFVPDADARASGCSLRGVPAPFTRSSLTVTPQPTIGPATAPPGSAAANKPMRPKTSGAVPPATTVPAPTNPTRVPATPAPPDADTSSGAANSGSVIIEPARPNLTLTPRPTPAGGMVRVPAFDVLFLGVGPDGHVASLFPKHRALSVRGVVATGVRNSPKPPPQRVTLTLEALNSAREIWLVAAGTSKADAVAHALAGAPVDHVPAAGVHGHEATLWLLDAAAASRASVNHTA